MQAQRVCLLSKVLTTGSLTELYLQHSYFIKGLFEGVLKGGLASFGFFFHVYGIAGFFVFYLPA